MQLKTVICFLVFSTIAGAAFQVSGQPRQERISFDTKDSLTLSQILTRVLTTYPSVTRAQEAIQVAEAGVDLAKSAWYPTVAAGADYTRIGPVPELTIPNLGHFVMAPGNVYDATVSAYENIYDFDKTSRKVEVEKSNRELAEKNVALVRQRLTLLTSVSFYTEIYLQEAIRIKEAQISTLKQHLDFVTRMEQTGSATHYEILSTQVRLINAENQKVDLEASRQTQQATLNSLLGLPVRTVIKVQGNFVYTQPGMNPDSLIPYALDHRYEMVMVHLHEKHAQLELRSTKAMNYPSLGAFVDGGFKNGYFPDLNKFTPNFAAGVGLKVPIFDATRRRSSMRIAASQISMARSDLEQTTRDISTEVYQNETNMLASLKKIDQGNLQVNQAREALELAAISYKTGAITNLDLLDAETALEESRVNLLKARIEYAINVVRLNISVGNPVQ